ncbi:MAG: ATP synthase subunit I [Pseudomonadota bacterium]
MLSIKKTIFTSVVLGFLLTLASYIVYSDLKITLSLIAGCLISNLNFILLAHIIKKMFAGEGSKAKPAILLFFKFFLLILLIIVLFKYFNVDIISLAIGLGTPILALILSNLIL